MSLVVRDDEAFTPTPETRLRERRPAARRHHRACAGGGRGPDPGGRHARPRWPGWSGTARRVEPASMDEGDATNPTPPPTPRQPPRTACGCSLPSRSRCWWPTSSPRPSRSPSWRAGEPVRMLGGLDLPAAAPQPRRRVLDGHRLHLDPLADRDRRGGRHRADGPAAALHAAGRSRSGLVLGGALGNLIDRIFRAPGPLQGHVVDFVSLFAPERRGVRRCSTWPTRRSPAAACCSSCSRCSGIELDGTRDHDAQGPHDGLTSASCPVPDGLDGMRRRRRARAAARPVPHRRRRRSIDAGARRWSTGAPRRKSDRLHGGRLAGGRPCPSPSGRRDRGRARGGRGPHRAVRGRRHRGGRQAGRRGRAPEPGLDRPDRRRRAGRAGLPRRHLGRGRAAGHRAPAGRRHHRA